MGPRRTPDIEAALNEQEGFVGRTVADVTEDILSVATSEQLASLDSLDGALSMASRVLVGTGNLS